MLQGFEMPWLRDCYEYIHVYVWAWFFFFFFYKFVVERKWEKILEEALGYENVDITVWFVAKDYSEIAITTQSCFKQGDESPSSRKKCFSTNMWVSASVAPSRAAVPHVKRNQLRRFEHQIKMPPCHCIQNLPTQHSTLKEKHLQQLLWCNLWLQHTSTVCVAVFILFMKTQCLTGGPNVVDKRTFHPKFWSHIIIHALPHLGPSFTWTRREGRSG